MTTEPEVTARTIFEMNPLYLLRWEDTQTSYVMLYPEGMIKLNETAGQILARVNGSASVDEIVGNLVETYGNPLIAEDVRAFLEMARAKRWIRPSA